MKRLIKSLKPATEKDLNVDAFFFVATGHFEAARSRRVTVRTYVNVVVSLGLNFEPRSVCVSVLVSVGLQFVFLYGKERDRLKF